MTNHQSDFYFFDLSKKIAWTSYAKNTMDQIKRMTDYKQLDADLSQISATKYRERKVLLLALWLHAGVQLFLYLCTQLLSIDPAVPMQMKT